MRHTKTFLRADGSKVQISVTLLVDFSDTPRYDFDVYICGPRKRTFFAVLSHDDYTWRRLDREARNEADMAAKMKYVTMAEVQETALELWAKVQPVFDKAVARNLQNLGCPVQ